MNRLLLSIILLVSLFSCRKQGPSEFDENPKAGSAPGIGFYSKDLQSKINNLKEVRAKKKYEPRTKHKDKSGNALYANRLYLETSPYLLQHAHNPVNWFAWSEEPFKLAKKLNRPILLSVGYSTCHWCHVMEEESFEDIEIAKYLNENYISIKVDREERPDVDTVYMSAVQAITGRGGWPMTVWLTPDKKPIYGGTYFPPRDGDRGSRIGFMTLIKKFKEHYINDPKNISEVSNRVKEAVIQSLEGKKNSVKNVSDEVLHKTFNYYKAYFDPVNGGIKRAPKFPSSFPLKLLLRYHKRFKNKKALEMVTRTLDRMASGGIYDQVAGGFHRYSTDEIWLAPHFEKMLYDNALLASIYTEAYVATKDQKYKVIAKEILDYILREMTNKEGLFYSATDADSLTESGHREEGYYFTWTMSELSRDLGPVLFKKANKIFKIADKGNFEGRNILNLHKIKDRFKYKNDFKAIQKILIKTREKRARPIRDDKVITSWNGLVISALAQAGYYFNDDKYQVAAKKAALTIENRLINKDRLYRIFNEGKVKIEGFLNDYTFYIQSLLDLYELQSDEHWLRLAIKLDKVLEDEFEDKTDGAFYSTGIRHEKMFAKQKTSFDGAIPTGNSIALLNLQRLYLLTGLDKYRKRYEKLLDWYSSKLNENPMSLSEMLVAVDFKNDRTQEIFIIFPNKDVKKTLNKYHGVLQESFKSNKVISFVKEGSSLLELPVLKGKTAIDNKVTAYVCEKGVCQLPTTDISVFKAQIK